MAKPIDIDALAARILRGDLGRLSQAELDAVLSWISGSERLGASELIHRVGVPRERPDVMRQVYTQLDVMLFVDGRLHWQRAGVQAGAGDKIRRARFRRLMTAFHPDRHPDSADWLTPRSQAVLEAYRSFRAGREGDEPQRPTRPGAAGRPRPARGKKATGRKWPAERNSARLTPERAGLLTRMRIRLRNIDNLQGKILAALAVVALVPVVWVYFSYKPYRDRLAPSPTPSEIAATEPAEHQAPATLHPPQPDSRLEPTDEPPSESSEPEPTTHPLVASAEDLPDEIDLRPGREPEDTTDPEATTDKEPLLNQPTRTFDQLLAYNEAEPQAESPPEGTDSTREPPRKPETGNRKPTREPQAEPTPESTEPPREPARNPETGTRNPARKPQADSPPESSESTREPTRNPTREPQAESPPERTAPPREPPIEARIQHLLDTYSLQFSVGNLDGIMTLLASEPRENHNRGRDWFRDSYRQLFEESAARRISIEVMDIEQRSSDWRVAARFELQVNYPSRESVRAEQTAEYTVVSDHDGKLRIQAIDY